jgi:hypothetical protein
MARMARISDGKCPPIGENQSVDETAAWKFVLARAPLRLRSGRLHQVAAATVPRNI